MDSFKYDVAFSFLAQDEPLALQLNDLVQDRMRTFIYSEQQKKLAGTDGERAFNAVFGEEARVVVVLYRKGWGETAWTRIEETAIKNRAMEHGYDFTLFVPLEDPPTVPKWLPKNRLWFGLKRFGANGAASVIEARVQEQGGEPAEESIKDRAARLSRTVAFERERSALLNSHAGLDAAQSEFDALATEVETLAKEMQASAAGIEFRIKRARQVIVVVGPRVGLSIAWQPRYGNTLSEAKLVVAFYSGHPPFPGVSFYESPEPRSKTKYEFTITRAKHNAWTIGSGPSEKLLSSKELATQALKEMMDRLHKASDDDSPW